MHNAPPVAFPVGRFVWGRVVWVAVTLLSVAGMAVWSLQAQTSSAALWAAGLFWLICVGGATLWLPRQMLTTGDFFWDGQAWSWRPAKGADASLVFSVGLDTGDGLMLLVRLRDNQNFGTRGWACAWFFESEMPSKWHGFRCAVYSRPKADVAAQSPDPDHP